MQADRADFSPHDLQSSTVAHIKDRHHSEHSGSSGELGGDTGLMSNGDSIETLEAVYERDEITGPLGTAQGGNVHKTIERDTVEVVHKGR